VLEVALADEDEISGRVKQAAAQLENQLARARYGAYLARRRYMMSIQRTGLSPTRSKMTGMNVCARWKRCSKRTNDFSVPITSF
jgi:hypothetical protein